MDERSLDDGDVRRAVADLRAWLEGGDLDNLAADALGSDYAALERVALVVRIVLSDWHDFEDQRTARASMLSIPDTNYGVLARQTLDIWARLAGRIGPPRMQPGTLTSSAESLP